MTTEATKTEVGSYFISNYPPYSQWSADRLPEVEAAMAAANGLGPTILPALAVEDEVPDGTTVELRPFARPSPGRQLGLAWRRGSPLESDFRLLGNLLRPGKAAQGNFAPDGILHRFRPGCGEVGLGRARGNTVDGYAVGGQQLRQ